MRLSQMYSNTDEEERGKDEEERGQIPTPKDFASRLFDIRVRADVIRRNTKAEGKLSLTADLGPPLK